MSATCRELERALEAQDAGPGRLAEVRAHAADCAACREGLALWDAVPEAARALRRRWDAPALWPRIAEALAEESSRPRAPRLPAWLGVAAALALLALAGAAAWRLRQPTAAPEPGDVRIAEEERLLSERALADVDRSEAEYVRSIDALARLAETRLARAESPLLMSYREKLLLLDAAIAECRRQAEGNRFNAHLRRELLELYRDKQLTLRAVMEEPS
jgi:hypothetical protein